MLKDGPLGVANEVYKLFDLNKDSFVVDLGACWGEFTRFILDKYNCRVDAYEPNSDTFKVKHPKLRFYNKAVYDGTKVKYHKTKQRTDSSTSMNKGKFIETVDIRDIVSKPIDLMKVNIEGAEMVLAKADLSNVRQIVIEFHSFIGDRFDPPITKEAVDGVVDHIMSFGFSKKLIDDEPSYFFYK